MATGTSTISDVAAAALCNASLSEQQARDLFRQGEEAVVFALLDLTKQLAEAQGKTNVNGNQQWVKVKGHGCRFSLGISAKLGLLEESHVVTQNPIAAKRRAEDVVLRLLEGRLWRHWLADSRTAASPLPGLFRFS